MNACWSSVVEWKKTFITCRDKIENGGRGRGEAKSSDSGRKHSRVVLRSRAQISRLGYGGAREIFRTSDQKPNRSWVRSRPDFATNYRFMAPAARRTNHTPSLDWSGTLIWVNSDTNLEEFLSLIYYKILHLDMSWGCWFASECSNRWRN